MATLDDVWQAALIRIGLPEEDGYLDDQAVKRTLVSKAQRDVASRIDWPELAVETTYTIDGTDPLDLPADENFLRLNWVAYEPTTSESYQLLPKARKDLVAFDSHDQGNNTRYYAVTSDGLGQLQLRVSPAPRDGAVIRISYVRKPSDLLNDTDPLLIPDHIIEAVELRTAVLIALRKGDIDRASIFKSEYDDSMRFLNDEVVSHRGPYLPRTRQDW